MVGRNGGKRKCSGYVESMILTVTQVGRPEGVPASGPHIDRTCGCKKPGTRYIVILEKSFSEIYSIIRQASSTSWARVFNQQGEEVKVAPRHNPATRRYGPNSPKFLLIFLSSGPVPPTSPTSSMTTTSNFYTDRPEAMFLYP